MPNIHAVVFDIGNVLLEWRPERFYDREIGADRRAALFAEVDLEGMNLAVDHGAPMKASVEALAQQYPQWDAEIRLWHDRWAEMASPAIDRSVRLLRALRVRGVPVFACSNFGIETFEFAKTKYDFLSEFDVTVTSGPIGICKPDAGIYAAVESLGKIAGQHLLFADDKLENLVAAQARGWQVHHFTDAENFADLLVAEGLLSQTEAA